MIQIDPQALTTLPAEPPLSKPALTRFLNRARVAVDLSGEVEVLLTSDAELKRLNRAFRKKNKSTDILSFPAPPEISEQHAGDLAISLETAARQASQYSHTLSDELRILILHGLLHLSGLDHETDQGEMAARETRLRAALRLPTTLIARVIPSAKARPARSENGRLSERREESPHLSSARSTATSKAEKRARSRKSALKPGAKA